MRPTRYALIHRRFIAFVMDTLLAVLAGILPALPLVIYFYRQRPEPALSIGYTCHDLSLRAFNLDLFPGRPWVLPLACGIMLAVSLLYFSLFESSRRQATPGKMVMGIFVADLRGRRISFPRALGRSLAKVLSMAICWLGYILALFNPRSQALHDLLAGTLVLELELRSQPAAGGNGPVQQGDNIKT